MNKKLFVGQKVWVKSSNFWKKYKEPFEATVSKVGNKFFQIEELKNERFFLDTFRQETVTNYESRIYLTLQEILDEDEKENLCSELYRFFNTSGNLKKIDVAALRLIRKITLIVEKRPLTDEEIQSFKLVVGELDSFETKL